MGCCVGVEVVVGVGVVGSGGWFVCGCGRFVQGKAGGVELNTKTNRGGGVLFGVSIEEGGDVGVLANQCLLLVECWDERGVPGVVVGEVVFGGCRLVGH